MPKCYILISPPCGGKSTYAKKRTEETLSCDQLRLTYFGKVYKHNTQGEAKVWEAFYNSVRTCVILYSSFIVDNTNCRATYINKILSDLTEDYEVIYVWFDTPLWKLKFRNYKRWLFTGKWIPEDVIKRMKKNYDELKINFYPQVKSKSIVIKN